MSGDVGRRRGDSCGDDAGDDDEAAATVSVGERMVRDDWPGDAVLLLLRERVCCRGLPVRACMPMA